MYIRMKKFLPLILLALGLIVVLGAYFFVSRSRQDVSLDEQNDEASLLSVPLSERPVVTLTPRSNGYWLDMEISKFMIGGAETLDYELLYTLPDGRQQGVPGMIELSGRDLIQVELLLGSESSGNFRYDEGVETGTMTLRFRNSSGQLLVQFVSEFHLQSNTDTLTSVDGGFEYLLDEISKAYFVTMNTIGYPDGLEQEIQNEPYGVFTSSSEPLSGDLSWVGDIQYWNGQDWSILDTSRSPKTGIFVR